MKKIVTVVGARPQFIKAAAVSHKLREKFCEVLVHTGQHYDANMSDVFFDELNIPRPDYNLGISGGTHAQMTGSMLVEIEAVLTKEQPDMLLVYGDTNSTLAAALAAAKLNIPIAHVEAGVRTGSDTNPEEINRRCTDHVATLNLTCTQLSLENLYRENKAHTAHFVGDPMYDAFVTFGKKADTQHHSLEGFDGTIHNVPPQYIYLTCHRQENTTTDQALTEILAAMEVQPYPVVYPVHPRNQERASRICKKEGFTNTILCKPVGYLTSAYLVNHAEKIVTDSGGLQREAFFAKKQCVTILPFPVWEETLVDNRNVLCSPSKDEIITKLNLVQNVDANYQPFGDGHSAEKIVAEIEKFLNR